MDPKDRAILYIYEEAPRAGSSLETHYHIMTQYSSHPLRSHNTNPILAVGRNGLTVLYHWKFDHFRTEVLSFGPQLYDTHVIRQFVNRPLRPDMKSDTLKALLNWFANYSMTPHEAGKGVLSKPNSIIPI